MATDPDPYRTLGLERGASLDEVKRAYRRLAKANHPDAAGEAALPRFLAIQAAYDQIAGPEADEPARRRPAAIVAPRPDAPGTPTRDRAGATYRAYGGRPTDRRPGRHDRGPRPRPRAGPTRAAAGRPRPPRPPKKATLGSTSYDGVEAETVRPGLGWRVVVRHDLGHVLDAQPQGVRGPAQARPGVPGAGPASQAGGASTAHPTSRVEPPAAEAPRRRSVRASADAHDRVVVGGHRRRAAPTDRASDASRGQRQSASPTSRSPHGAPPPRWSPHPTPTSRPPTTLAPCGDGWMTDRPTLGARIGRAVVGWAPIALGIGWRCGEISGCGRFAATCPPDGGPGRAGSPSSRRSPC